MKSRLNNLSTNQFTLLISIFYVVIFNFNLFVIIKQTLDKLSTVNFIFIASMPLFLVFALGFIFSLFSIKYLLKPTFIIVTLCSAIVSFAARQYQIIFNYDMFENIFQTNTAEAFSYVNFTSVISFLLLGVLPSILIYKTNIIYKPFIKELRNKLYFMLSMLLGIIIIGLFFYQNYVSLGRSNDLIKRSIVPTYAVGSLIKYIDHNYFQKPLVFKQQGLDAANMNSNDKHNLVVLIVGETARAMNYQYYGYHRPTNSYTKAFDIIPFKNAQSCGTATAVSLPCMFSSMDRKNYQARRAKAQDNALDVLTYGGIAINWFDNDSGCKGVCKRVKHITINPSSDTKLCDGSTCYDQVLIKQLTQLLSTPIEQDTLIVLHLMGSHGPTYYQRYPDKHRKFVPDCQRGDIQNCTKEELINTYDNTILYSDYIIAQAITKLKQQHNVNTALLYLSDHGESLGEHHLYLHGAPYAIAPKEQTTIPMLAWLSTSFSAANKIDSACIKTYAKTGKFSQDDLFSTLLGMMDIRTNIYRPKMDIFSSCKGT